MPADMPADGRPGGATGRVALTALLSPIRAGAFLRRACGLGTARLQIGYLYGSLV
jgi:hypothetical protein